MWDLFLQVQERRKYIGFISNISNFLLLGSFFIPNPIWINIDSYVTVSTCVILLMKIN